MKISTSAWRARLSMPAMAILSAFLPAPALAPAFAQPITAAKVPACPRLGDAGSYCGLPQPEDIEVLPDGKGVIASDMRMALEPGGFVRKPGSLKWLDTRTGAVTILYPTPSTTVSKGGGAGDWGDAACPGEIGARLLPHGINLSRRKDGAWQLLVVNHGGRESVEFFELARAKGKWSLRWRGCAVPPLPELLNDVAALPDGGLVVTNMYRMADLGEGRTRAAAGEDTGLLWRWSKEAGFVEQPGGAAPAPNGVTVDAAGRYAYLNTTKGGGEVRKIDLASGTVAGSVAVPNPDNSSWTTDGRLLVAGVLPGQKSLDCFRHPLEPCGESFAVYAVDVSTMTATRLLTHAGPPLGGATVAVQSGRDMLIGSITGERIMVLRKQFPR